MTLDPLSKPALLVVDMQNDFVRAGAPLEVPDARETVAQHRRLLEVFRAGEAPVVFLRYVAGPQNHLADWASKLAWAAELGEKYGLNLASFHPDSGTEHYLDMLKTHGPLLNDAVFEPAKPG